MTIRRKTSTMSIVPPSAAAASASVATAGMPQTSVSRGLTGTHAYPAAINVLRTQNKIPEGVTQWSYMTDTDAWFVQTDVKYGLVYVQRDSDEFGGMPTNDWDTENQKFKNRMRFSAGWVDPRGIIGSVGG